MLGFAALILAAATAQASPALTSTTPWWEKVTYTISGDGEQQACLYQSSIGGARTCDATEASSPIKAVKGGSAGAYTKITIERRFTPGERPDPGKLESGDTLLGGRVMALAIDGTGTVHSCRILVSSGDVRPAYGCDELRAERFEAGATRQAREVRQAFMTIVVYGHEEHLA